GPGADPGPGSRVFAQLRRLQDDAALAPDLAAEVRRALEGLEGPRRRPFEERAQAWVARARAEIDRGFAGVWGLDLGTTTCAVAIFDTRTQQTVLCPWKGHGQFASTLSLDRQGNEVVGLTGEEVLAGWVAGHIAAAKRAMGTGTLYRVRAR